MRAEPTSRIGLQPPLTFKGNLRDTRYGWLRLTPAYSVHLVSQLLAAHGSPGGRVLDPFCGTGTTALACAERGIECDTTDINPFLLWLTRVKTARYARAELTSVAEHGASVARAIRRASGRPGWVPPIHQIEKWWSPPALSALSRALASIGRRRAPRRVRDLLELAFCRTLIEHANVSFGHQSMSFRNPRGAPGTGAALELARSWQAALCGILRAAQSEILATPRAIHCDARDLRQALKPRTYACVITSPPYPNRMSYIRELRPYMYWLGHLGDGRQAGELDWQAIGGTWGCATSNVAKWSPGPSLEVPYASFGSITRRIALRSDVLGRYVTKYFHDMLNHCRSLFVVVRPRGSVHYIVGNSKFYDVLLPVEEIYAAMFEAVGFQAIRVDKLRKRTSKKELFEFVVSAQKPA